MSTNEYFENSQSTGGTVLRRAKVFGIKTMTVVITASMLLSGVPTAAIAEGLEEAGVIATQGEAEPTTEPATQDTSTTTDEGATVTETTETTDSSDTPAADTSTQQDTSAAQDTPASDEQVATEADVKLDLGSAYIIYNGQDISLPSTKVTVPTGKDFKFTATANTGFDLTAVKLTVNGTESELTADADGAYTVTADQVAAGAAVKLETAEQAEEAATQNNAIAITSLDDEDAQADDQSDESGIAVVDVDGDWSVTGNDALEVGKFAVYTANDFSGAVTWSTSDESIATVDSNGVVTAVAAGKVTITATYGTETASKTITVNKASSSRWSSGNTATFVPTISNAEVAYFNWHSSSDTSNIAFTPVASGSILSIEDYNSSDQAGYVVFFVKPSGNYLFTGLGADGNGDTYVVGSGEYGNIAGYPNISAVMTAAKAAGYVAAFGYSRAKRDTPPTNSAFQVTAQSPDMTVIATSSKTSDVLAGETLTFTIVMTPQLTGSNRDKVTGVQVNSVTVNGLTADCSDVVDNGDGTFTATVSYTVTEADCNRSSVDLVVNATSTYEASLSTSLSSITTTSSINKTATATCAIAPKSDVTYEFKSGTSDKTLPNGIYSVLPKDSKTYQKGTKVTASKTLKSGAVYEDTDNGGYWTFGGWDANSKTMTENGITFTGTWTFTEYSKYTVKYVDESGKELADSKTVSGNKVGDVIKKDAIEHPEIKGYAYSKTTPDKLTISKDESENVISIVYKQKAGKAGYNLVLDSASWTAPDETTQTTGTQKWYYDYGFAKNDTFTVTDSEPTATNRAFIGWMDKERDDQAAAIREAGDEVTYIYSNNQTYTLDALWASLSATGEDVTYDGDSHSVTVDVNINEGTGLDSKYVEQAKKLITTGDVEYSTDGGAHWSTVKPSFTNAGSYTVNVRQNVTVGGKTTTLTAEATVNIAKRTVTLESADLSKDYDGSALTNGDTALKTETGWVKDEGATYSFTGSQTDVGESDNAFTYTLKNGTNPDNYIITKSEGKLTVNDRETKYAITVEGNSTTVKYDGDEHTASGITTASSTYTNDKGVTFIITADTTDPKSTDVTSVDNKVSNVKVTLNGKDVTKQFKVTTKDGKLTIDPRTVKLTSASDEKEYDGKALKNSKVTATEFNAETGEGFIEGEGATYKVTGSQTKPGSSENTFSYTLKDNTKADNYTITTENGTLTVTNRKAKYEITVEGNSATETYDGTVKSVNGVKTTTFTVDGNTYTVEGLTASGAKGTDADSYTNTVTGTAVVKDAEGNDVTSEFAVTTKNGTLKINKRDVTIKSKSAERVYNGQPLTKHEAEVKSGSIADADKDKVTYNYTGTITNVGETGNAFTVSGLDAKNYNVKTEYGKLKVTPVADKVTVTITEHGGSYTYDGTEKTAAGYDVSSSNDLYTANDFTFSGTATVSGTNAGTYEMQLKASDFTNNSANFTNVDFKIVDATLTIAKRQVTLKSETASKVYDGTPLTAKTVTIASGSFAEGQGFKAEATGSVTSVSEGEVDNEFEYTLTGGATEGENGNYIITKQVGKLSIAPVTREVVVTITGHKTEAKYDGTEKSATGYDVAINNDLYKEDDFSYEGSSEVKAANADTYEMGLTKGTFTNDSQNFTNVKFNVTDGELAISKRDVVLTSASAEKEYDGTPLTRSEQTDVKVTGDGFADGEGATYTITGTQTVVGNSENTFSYALNEGTSEDNYNIETRNGTLNVTNRGTKYEVTVKANSTSATYDGKAHEAKGVETYEFTENGQKYTVSGLTTEDPKQTDAGTYTNNIIGTAKVTDAKGNDVTEQFTVKTENGQLVIEKAKVILKSASDTWVYDGKSHSKEEMETVSGFAKGEGATFTYGKSVTNVSEGKVKNTFSYELNSGTNADNYEIKTETGTLQVTPVTDKVTVTITGNTKTETFDGTQKSVEGYKFEASNNLYTEGCVTFNGNAVATGTIVNTYDMGLKKSDFTNNSSNFSNVEFKVTDGWLKIEPASIDDNDAEWTKNDVSKFYDGTKLTAYAATAQDKYGNSLTVEYSTDGETWVSDPTKISLTHAGEVTVKLRARSDNYNSDQYFTSSETITVNKRKVAMTSATDTKEYDGTALTNDGVTVSEFNVEKGEGFIEGEGATYDVTGTITNVGSVDNAFTYTLNKGTNKDDYEITATPGKLTITADANAVVVTIKAKSETVVYDGEEHTVTGYEVAGITGGNGKFTAADVALNDGVDLTVSGTDVAVDSATGAVVAYTKALNTNDFKSTNANFSNVTFQIDPGASNVSLTITKRPVKLTSGSASKDYDGTPLTNGEVTATAYDADKKEGFVGEQGFTAKTTGSQTDAGSSKNTFTYELNKGTSATNYNITKDEGDLTVNKLSADNLNLTGTDVTYDYDGKPHAAGTATAEPKDSEGNALNDAVTIEYQLASDPESEWVSNPSSITQTDATTTAVVVNVRATSPNFEGTATATETITIKKATLKVSTPSASKVYDGTALTAAATESNVKGLVAGETAAIKATGSQTEVGSSDNTYGGIEWGTAKASNYSVELEGEGTLTVLAQSIDPKTDPSDPDKRYTGAEVDDPSDSTYDGDTHKWAPTVKSAEGTELTEGEDYTVTYKRGDDATDNFTDAGTITVVITGKGNYAGTVTKTYEIKKATLEVSTPSASKVYDGKALTAEATASNIKGLVGSETATVKATGSQTEVGSSDNFYGGIEWGTAKESNYSVELEGEGTLTVLAQSIDPKTDPSDPDKRYTGAEVDDPSDSTYDGDTHKWAPTVKSAEGTELTEGEDYTVTYKRGDDATDNFTDAGTITVVITGKGNYAGTVTKTYEIKKREVTITSDNGDFVYNGKAQKQETAGVTDGSFVEGEGVASYTFTRSVKKVGDEADNEFTYTLNSNTKADNYKITKKYGKLTVRKSDEDIVVTLTGYEGTYDGAEHKATSHVAGTLPEGFTTKVVSDAAITNVGEKTAKVDSFTIYDESGNDVTDQFNVDTKSTATLKVTKREITVTSVDATKVYDGTELTKHVANVTSETGLVSGEELAYSFTGSQTEVGGERGNNTFTVDWTKSTADEGNYKVTCEPGTLTVTAQSIDPKDVDPDDPDPSYKGVTVNDPADDTYDANAHKWAPTVETADGTALEAGKDYTVTYKRDGVETTDFTNAGTITVVITGKGNYTGEVTKEYTINPAEVTLSSNTRVFVYNGSKQGDHAVNGSGAFELFKSQTALLAATGEVQNVGDTAVNTISYTMAAGYSADNYVIELAEGNLSVTPQSIDPKDVDPDDPDPSYKGVTTDDPTDVTYDGTEHKWTPVVKDADGKELVEGTDYDVTYDTSDFVNSGTITVIITGKGNFTGTITKTYRIVPAALRVVTASASKTYNGTALTNDGVTVTGLVAGDVITVTATGAQTQVGSSENTYSIDWMQVNKDNYTLTDELGTLTVTEAAAPAPTPDNNGTTPVAPDNNGRTVIDTIVEALDSGYRAITGDTEEEPAEEEKISDAENPLANLDKKRDTCWVHWYMIVCALATAVYGIFVGLHRNKHTRRLEDDLNDILGNDDESKN